MQMTGEEIRLRGLAALRRELGRAGLVRFLQHFETGSADYTRQREKLLASLSIKELRSRARRSKKSSKRNS
jgi:hypothetical protein